MRIGLIDVDGHNFPNLALMRISAYHKAQGDEVEWWWSDFIHYDIVYMSKIFSDAYSPDVPEPMNADKVVKGGTGYCISLGADGKENFDQSKNHALPDEIEHMFPDYSIYPQYNFAVALTSRGCPRGCGFCHVVAKEGRCAVKVADVCDFYNGQDEIVSLDPNITACAEKRDLMKQYRETGANIDFSQGFDIRLTNDDDIADINAMRIKNIHFAWDNPANDLRSAFDYYSTRAKHKPNGGYGGVYILTNYEKCNIEEHVERALFRIYAMRDRKYDPYLMLYDKPHAPKILKHMQRWCNNKIIFKSCPKFEDYDRLRCSYAETKTTEQNGGGDAN